MNGRAMKTLIPGLMGSLVLVSLAGAGTAQPTAKEIERSSVCPQFFADTGWNLGLFGTYAFPNGEIINNALLRGTSLAGGELTRGYLNTDHAWGGGIDAKYFFHRYFGVGIEGYALAANGFVVDIAQGFGDCGVFRHRDLRAVGSAFGTFTLRYPIRCTRFAPYAFAGGGAIFNGGERSIKRLHFGGINEFDVFTEHTGSQTELAGQFGGGIEFRMTPHIGITSDFSWNIVNGRNNNFGMVRTGINFAF